MEPCQIPSLQDLCADVILKSRKQDVLELYGLSETIERFGDKHLKEYLDESDYTGMMRAHNERLAAERRLSAKGEVLQKERVNISENEMSQGYYPLKCLLQGVDWPEGVEPSRREEYLSPDDFFAVFGMSKEAFKNECRYKRLRMKKEKGLF